MAWRLGTPMSHYIIFVEIKNIVEKKAEGGGSGQVADQKKKEYELPKGRCSEDLNVRTETGEQSGNHQLCW